VPETIKLFRILLVAPSDVTEEHLLVAGLVNEWNVHHGDGAGAGVELMNWQTHAHPAAGRRPQSLINRQFADRADIVLGIFWRRLGSPTGRAASGTVEEIQRAQRRRKKVMVYFSRRPAMESSAPDRSEQGRVERFKQRLGQVALYGTYADVHEFEITVRKDLALVMRELVSTRRTNR
jgi:hypothetical protein